MKILVVLPDGRLAFRTPDGNTELWDLASGACTATFEGHSLSVGVLAVLHDGMLASVARDGRIKRWDLAPAGYVFQARRRFSERPLAILPDGRLASGAKDGQIEFWELASGACTATFEGHRGRVNALTVLPDGRLASGGLYGDIKLWDLANGTCTATFKAHNWSVNALTVLPDGRLASGANDRQIKFWDLASGICTATFEGHNSSVKALTVLPDGRLASGGRDGKIKIWDSSRDSHFPTPDVNGHTASVRALAVLPDGRLASGSDDGTIRLWDSTSRVCTATLVVEEHSYEGEAVEDQTSEDDEFSDFARYSISYLVKALEILPDGHLASFISVSQGLDAMEEYTWSEVRLWDTATCICTHTFGSDHACSMAVLPDGRIAIRDSEDRFENCIILWNPTSGGWTTLSTKLLWNLAVLPDGRLVACAETPSSHHEDNQASIWLWDPSTGSCTFNLEGDTGRVNALAALPDGRLATGAIDGKIKVWDLDSGACTASFEGQRSINLLAVLPDGRLVFGSGDQTIRLWDPAGNDPGSGQLIFVADDQITALAVTPRASIPGALLLVAGDASGRLHWLRLG